MNQRAIILDLWICAALGAAVGCSGVDKNENNNTPVGEGTLTGEVSSTVTCDASPESDCAGTLYLVLMADDPVSNPYQTPEAFEIIPGVDLSSGTASYTLNNVPAGQWFISGFLDDDDNAGALRAPDKGDPFSYPAPEVTITPDNTTTQNVTLTGRMP